MGVRDTEGSIPEGFDKASLLGEAIYSNDRDYVLVSYLSSPLRMSPSIYNQNYLEKNKHFIKNTYVVFVNTEKDPPPQVPQNYDWEIKITYSDNNGPDKVHSDNHPTKYGILEIDTRNIAELSGLRVRIKAVDITVKKDGVFSIPTLNQRVDLLFGDLDALLDGKSRNSRGGNPMLSRVLSNDYGRYFQEIQMMIDDGNIADKIPLKLLAAIAYDNVQHFYAKYYPKNQIKWERYLNKNIIPSKDIYKTPLGLFNIYPHIIGMLLEKIEIGETETILKGDAETDARYSSRMFSLFKKMAEEDKSKALDLFNKIRFPKSCIRLCHHVLEQLLKTHTNWSGQNSQQVMANAQCVKTITSEMYFGLVSGFEKRTPQYDSVFYKRGAPYIAVIVAPESGIVQHLTYQYGHLGQLPETDLLQLMYNNDIGDLDESVEDVWTQHIKKIEYGGDEKTQGNFEMQLVRITTSPDTWELKINIRWEVELKEDINRYTGTTNSPRTEQQIIDDFFILANRVTKEYWEGFSLVFSPKSIVIPISINLVNSNDEDFAITLYPDGDYQNLQPKYEVVQMGEGLVFETWAWWCRETNTFSLYYLDPDLTTNSNKWGNGPHEIGHMMGLPHDHDSKHPNTVMSDIANDLDYKVGGMSKPWASHFKLAKVWADKILSERVFGGETVNTYIRTPY